MKITFQKYNQYSEPQALSWNFEGKEVYLEFESPVSAAYSEKLKSIFVENSLGGLIYHYGEDGRLLDKKEIPTVDGYKFLGINQNKKSESGVALLFHPEAPGIGNEWRDTEQYELLTNVSGVLGRYLDIYR